MDFGLTLDQEVTAVFVIIFVVVVGCVLGIPAWSLWRSRHTTKEEEDHEFER